MSKMQVVSHKRSVERLFDRQMKQAATMIGGTLEGHAKELAPFDTGLLRNSITYALGGETPHVGVYASEPKQGKAQTVGKYEGSPPKDEENQITVYVGTNVQYGPYQELGAPSINLPARPYLRPAVENSEREILQIVEQCFSVLK